jgi:hypothetical protein
MVRRPAEVAVEVEIEGGATRLCLDDAHLGAVGGTVRQKTRGDAEGSGQVAVRIEGGASGLTVNAASGLPASASSTPRPARSGP